MKEATTAFESTRGAAVEITADPAPHWMDKAKAEADLVSADPRSCDDGLGLPYHTGLAQRADLPGLMKVKL